MALKRNPKLLDQLQYCEKNQVEVCVIIGSSEVQNGTVKIRDVKTREEVRFLLRSAPQFSSLIVLSTPFSSQFTVMN